MDFDPANSPNPECPVLGVHSRYHAFIRKYDGTGNELWTRQFAPENLKSRWKSTISAAVVDRADNISVVGSTPGTLAGQRSSGGADAFVRKYSPFGNELWARQFGHRYYDGAESIAIDGSDNIYVAGNLTTRIIASPFGDDRDSIGFVRKYNASGNLLWMKRAGTGSSHGKSEEINNIAVDGLGQVYVVGSGDWSGSGRKSYSILARLMQP